MDKIKLSTKIMDIESIISSNDWECKIRNSKLTTYNIDCLKLIRFKPELISFYKNIDGVNMDLIYSYHQCSWYLYMTFNPNKIYKYLNSLEFPVDTLNEEEFWDVIEYIDYKMYNNNLNIDVYDMKIKEYHVCFDIITNLSYSNYFNIYNSLTPPGKYRMTKKYVKDTIYYENKSCSLNIYDKNQKHKLDYGVSLNENITRCELREKKISIQMSEFQIDSTYKQSINKILEFFNSDIINSDNDLISTILNSDNKSISKIFKEITNILFALGLKKFCDDNGIKYLKDAINKELSKSENEKLSRVNSKIKKYSVLDTKDFSLYDEIKFKLESVQKFIYKNYD